MDKLAKKLGLDPAELRLRNALATGDMLPTGQTVTCPAPVAELLQAVRDFPLPAAAQGHARGRVAAARRPRGRGRTGRGAPRRRLRRWAWCTCSARRAPTRSPRRPSRSSDGVATVICAAVETGQGFTTLARQIVQETLGIDEVHVAPVDTDQPPAGPACRGRHTWVSGGAVERAAKMVRTQLLQPLAHKFGMSTELLQITDGKITSYDGVLSTTVTEAMDGKELWATAQCRPHPTEPLDEAGQGDAFVGPRLLRDPRGRRRRHRAGLGPGGGAGASPRTSAGSSTPRQLAARIEAGRHPGRRHRPHGEPAHRRAA